MEIEAVDRGFVRITKDGGNFSIGYRGMNGRQYGLTVALEDVKELIARFEGGADIETGCGENGSET